VAGINPKSSPEESSSPDPLSEIPDPINPPRKCKRPGLKPKPLTTQFVYDCARLFLNQEEIGALCGLSQAQVSRRLNDEDFPELRDAFIAGRNVARLSLRRAQYKKAVEEGNLVAQIWLGKQELGQTDKREETQDVNVNVNVQYIAAWGKTPQELASSPPLTDSLNSPVLATSSENQDSNAPDDPDVIDGEATEDPPPSAPAEDPPPSP
jgi:predicted DNA-binding transcriptional regulator AlpA